MNGVRDVTVSDIDRLAGVLGRAFADDPVWLWMFGAHPERMAGLFALLLRHAHVPGGVSELAEDTGGIQAGALWDPPGRWKVSLSAQIRQAPRLIRVLGPRTFTVLRGLTELEEAHPVSPHWYLAILGTDPPAQGRGIGSDLLSSRLARCDDRGLPVYLESSKETNIAFYERFGFRVTGEMRMPRGGPLVWPMWRDPH